MRKSTITRRLFAAFSRYRPRVLTLAVLAAIAGLIVLANLSEEYSPRAVTRIPLMPADLQFEVGEPGTAGLDFTGGYVNMSYGWPLLWRQYVVGLGYSFGVVGEFYSASRLAGNVAIWLTMLAVSVGLCEWLARRYRPRIRFSLRTMLASTGLIAALLALIAAARNRANVQDPLIDAIEAHSGEVWVVRWGERWGPKWLDLLGAERYRRCVVGSRLDAWGADEEDDREGRRLLGELKRLPDLRYLSLTVRRLTPEIAASLGELRELETLQIAVGELDADSGEMLSRALGSMPRLRTLDFDAYWKETAALRNCLEAIGKQQRLERLRLKRGRIESQELALLAGLGNLKVLALEVISSGPEPYYVAPDPPLLSHLPALPRLETLDLGGSAVYDRDLPFIAALTRLKSLHLNDTHVTGAGLAELAPLESLEELAIDDEAESQAGFEALRNFKH
ncbi:MAG TPA: hypothetical protein VMV10_22045 [Pirellulales bacterium]|nr:hypothetical protein [Pirellulales bacterium]